MSFCRKILGIFHEGMSRWNCLLKLMELNKSQQFCILCFSHLEYSCVLVLDRLALPSVDTS